MSIRLLEEYDIINTIKRHIREDGTLDNDIRSIIAEVPTYKEITKKEQQKWCCDCAYQEINYFDRPCSTLCSDKNMWIDKLSDKRKNVIEKYFKQFKEI